MSLSVWSSPAPLHGQDRRVAASDHTSVPPADPRWVRPAAAGDVQRLLTQWKTRYSAFRNLAVVATDGRILASTDSERLRADPTPVDGSPDAPTAVLPGSTDSTGAQLDGQLDSGIVVFAPWSAVYMRAGHLLAELDLEDLRRIARDYTRES